MTPDEVSELLHVSVRTLANWRSDGKGPAFIRTGARHSPVLYREPDVAVWVDSPSRARRRVTCPCERARRAAPRHGISSAR